MKPVTRTFGTIAALVLGLWYVAEANSLVSGGDVRTLTIAKQLDIGSFCLANLPPGSIEVLDSQISANRTWFHVRVRLPRGYGGRARAYVFDRPPQTDGKLMACSDPQPGAKTILSGALNSATIDAYYSFPTGNQPAAWQVEKDGLRAELGKVSARFGKLFGGEFDPARRLLWISNTNRLYFADAGTTREGTIRMQATDVSLKGAEVRLGADYPPVTLDLKAVSDVARADKGHVAFDLDVQTGGIALAGGMLFADMVTFPAGNLQASYGDVTVDSAVARRVALLGTEEGVELTVSGVEAKVAALKHTLFPVASAIPASAVAIRSLTGPIAGSNEAAVLGEPTFAGLTIADARISVGDPAEGTELKGDGQIKIASLSAAAMDAEVSLPAPSIDALDFAAGANGVENLKLGISGLKSNPKLDADAVLKRFAAGRMQWNAAAAERLPVSMKSGTFAAGTLRLPFDIDLKARAGRAEFRLPDGKLVLDGSVDKFAARGVLTFSSQSGEKVALTVFPGSFAVKLDGQVAHEPLLFGERPTFKAGVTLGLSSPGGFDVAPGKARGTVVANVGAVVVNNGNLAFTDPKSGMRIGVPLQTSADTSLGIDLATLGVSLHTGRIDIQGLSAERPDGGTSELAGLKIVAPKLTIERLQVEAREGDARVMLKGATFEATHLEHSGDPFFAADLTAPLRIESIEARLGDTRESLTLVDGSVAGTTLATAKTQFRSRDGVRLEGASAGLEIRRLTMSSIDATIGIQDGTVRVDTRSDDAAMAIRTHFDVFGIDVIGQKDALDGTGVLKLNDLSIAVRSRLDVGDCPRDKQWKIKTSVELGRVDLDLQMKQSQLHGELVVADGKFNARNDGYSRCEFDKTHLLVKRQGFDLPYPCFRGLKAYTCKRFVTVVPELKAHIHWVAELHDLQVSGRIDNTRISLRGDRGVRVCPGKIALAPPLVVANYHPNIKKGGVVENLLRDVIRTVATAFESTIVSLFGTGISAASYLRNSLTPEQCHG